MKVIVVDTKTIIQPHKMHLFNFTTKVDCDNHNGVALVVPDDAQKRLNALAKGMKRLEYINNSDFVKGIVSVCYFDYNKKEQICVIKKLEDKHAKLVVEQLEKDLPDDTDIVFPIKQIKEAKNLINIGFTSPHKCDDNICLVKNDEDPQPRDVVLSELDYLLSQKKPICDLSFFLKPKAARYLRSLLTGKKTRNVELSGLLKAEQVRRKNGKMVYELDVDKSSMSSGEKEEVDGVKALFNFHTHPIEAYKRNDVKYAWPSAQDYLAYLYMAVEEKTVFHCVIALEGLYVLSLKSHNAPSDYTKRVRKTYKVDDDRHPNEYIKYIHGLPNNIFYLQYFPWNDVDKNQIVHVSFMRDDDTKNCFVNDKALEVSEKMEK